MKLICLKYLRTEKQDCREQESEQEWQNPFHVTLHPCDITKEKLSQKLSETGFDKDQISCISINRAVYNLSRKEFYKLLEDISSIMKKGSTLVFDYPSYENKEGVTEKITDRTEDETMAFYSIPEIRTVLSKTGFRIYEHLDSREADKNFFELYNCARSESQIHPDNSAAYCLAVKKS